MHIRSEIDDLIIFLITSSGLLKSTKWLPSTYVSTDTANLFFLSKISKSLNQEQKKYRIFLSGGDTIFSNKLSFTIISIGFANQIIYRNNAKINDDIYVTGNLGDSFAGLLTIKKKIKINSYSRKYFISILFLIKRFANFW